MIDPRLSSCKKKVIPFPISCHCYFVLFHQRPFGPLAHSQLSIVPTASWNKPIAGPMLPSIELLNCMSPEYTRFS
jgi:hypothetical protein